MTKNTKIFCVITICMMLAGLSSVPAAAKSITLTYSNFFPPTHIQSELPESWCKEVEKRTNGRVKVQYYAGQTLTNAKQTFDSVVDGICDIGLSALAYTRGRFPVMATIDLPFGYPSGEAATAVANELFDKFKPKEFDDVKFLYIHAHGPGLIHTKDKPIKTLADLKGVKIRSTGLSAEVVKALGGMPVAQPMPEAYQSLQKGVVDGSAYPLEANKGWKLGEVVDYATAAYSAAYTTAFYVVMNKDKWNSIDAKDQKAIEEISKEWAVKHGEAWDSSDMEGLRFFLQQGNTLIGLDSNEAENWKNAVAPLIDEKIKDLNKQGFKGEDIVNAVRATLKRFE